ncbi:unspecified product [Leishmania tarentolae]|uniref:Unspecified product n=1 Tax=Leishmania tarentolae TaxID=5689 RepID=A0A640KCA1_LEITA|nr:unspecified product [Leishmania tarentolae]
MKKHGAPPSTRAVGSFAPAVCARTYSQVQSAPWRQQSQRWRRNRPSMSEWCAHTGGHTRTDPHADVQSGMRCTRRRRGGS